jgi:hypothetical protein
MDDNESAEAAGYNRAGELHEDLGNSMASQTLPSLYYSRINQNSGPRWRWKHSSAYSKCNTLSYIFLRPSNLSLLPPGHSYAGAEPYGFRHGYGGGSNWKLCHLTVKEMELHEHYLPQSQLCMLGVGY